MTKNTNSSFYIIPVAILLAAIAIASGIVYKSKNTSTLINNNQKIATTTLPLIGYKAPLFNLKTAKGIEIKLEDLRGSNTLLVFWSTICQYCANELADLKQFADKYRGQITVLAVVYKEPSQAVKEYEEKEKINFTIVLDQNGEVVEKLYQIEGTPTHFLINKEGKIVSIWPMQANFYNLEYLIKEFLTITK